MEVSVVPVLAASDEGFEGPSKEVFNTPHWFDVEVGPINFYLNKVTALTIIAAALVGVVFWLGFRKSALVPRGLQNFCESVYDFIDTQIARGVIGPSGARFTPYLVILFSFVLVCNVMAIVPGVQIPPTSRFAVPVLLSAITYVIFNAVGIKAHGARAYFGEMVNPAPTAPLPIKFLIGPLEILSTMITRPFTLAVRLFANMFAGHILLLVFSLGAEYLVQHSLYVFGIASLLMAILMTGFEFVIDVLQAYVITILTAAYIGGALAEHGHEAPEAPPHAAAGVPAAAHA
jgi:F-type H+-transporting ATPase subunit a